MKLRLKNLQRGSIYLVLSEQYLGLDDDYLTEAQVFPVYRGPKTSCNK